MCGLAGAIDTIRSSSGLSKLELHRVRDLFIVSQLRGLDSAGLFTINHIDDKITLASEKAASTASEFVVSDTGRAFFDSENIKIIATHCRAATVGNITSDNAHPFDVEGREGRFVGMHNGTITGLAKDGKTDSQILYETISDIGLSDALRSVRDGAYALTFLDLEKRTFNIIRNVQRSLYYMEMNGILYYASEYDFLYLVRQRSSLIGKSSAMITAFPTQTLHSWSIDDPSEKKTVDMSSELNRTVYKSTKVEDKKEPGGAPSNAGFLGPPKEGAKYVEKSSAKAEKAAAEGGKAEANSSLKNRLVNVPMYYGYRGKMMTLLKATHILKEGCAFCTKEETIHGKAYFFANQLYVCEKCYEEEGLYKEYFGSGYEGRPNYAIWRDQSRLTKEEQVCVEHFTIVDQPDDDYDSGCFGECY